MNHAIAGKTGTTSTSQAVVLPLSVRLHFVPTHPFDQAMMPLGAGVTVSATVDPAGKLAVDVHDAPEQVMPAGVETMLAYGIPGVFADVDDERAHGKDERIGVKDFYDGVEFYYLFIKELAANN